MLKVAYEEKKMFYLLVKRGFNVCISFCFLILYIVVFIIFIAVLCVGTLYYIKFYLRRFCVSFSF